jgi:hypothetical protein
MQDKGFSLPNAYSFCPETAAPSILVLAFCTLRNSLLSDGAVPNLKADIYNSPYLIKKSTPCLFKSVHFFTQRLDLA